MNTKAKEGRGVNAPGGFALISQLRLTVPELMYLFFFIFFLAFTTWYEGRMEKKDNDNVNLQHNSFYPPLGK